jgi:hypothetical protein
MPEIHKFSLSYDAAEDRIAWDAEDQEGGTTRMWLTQRLVQAVVKAIVPMVVQTGPQELPKGGETAVQSWEQAAAMADFGKVPAVRPQPQSLTGLVRTINLRPAGEKIVLTFEFGGPQPLAIGTNLPQIRQTLSVIHGLYVAAGWPLDFWPAWIADPAAAGGARADIVN